MPAKGIKQIRPQSNGSFTGQRVSIHHTMAEVNCRLKIQGLAEAVPRLAVAEGNLFQCLTVRIAQF
jgi:hypothetical protein